MIDLDNKSTIYLQVIVDRSDNFQATGCSGTETNSQSELSVVNNNDFVILKTDNDRYRNYQVMYKYFYFLSVNLKNSSRSNKACSFIS